MDFSKCSLLHQNIATKIEELGNSVEKSYSLATNESTDASKTAQLAIFIRRMDEHYNITEDILSLVSLKNTIRCLENDDG